MIFIAAATDASIRAAYASAVASGGGTVIIPAGTITLTSPLPMASGVTYRGTAWGADATGIQGHGVAPTQGTVLQGDGTFACFAYHDTDLGTPPTDVTAFIGGMLDGCGLIDLSINNFSYGVKLGALYNPSCQNATFENLNIRNCTQWGFWCENFDSCTFRRVISFFGAVGGLYFGASGCSAFNCGDSNAYECWGVRDSYKAYGTVIRSRGGVDPGSVSMLNNFNCFQVRGQDIRWDATVSAAAIMSPAGPDITVPDSAAFPLDMPVTVSASVNGFKVNRIYYVVFSSGTTVRLSNDMLGSAITPTGSTAVNLLTKGYEVLRIGGYYPLSATAGYVAGVFDCVDSEGVCSALIQMHNVQMSHLRMTFVQQDRCYRTMVLRNVLSGSIVCPDKYTLDSDYASGTRVTIQGQMAEANPIDVSPYNGVGFGLRINMQAGQSWQQFTGGLFLRGHDEPDIRVNSDTYGLNVGPNILLGNYANGLRNGDTVHAAYGAVQGIYLTANGTVTLEPITTARVGLVLVLSNPTNFTETISSAGETVYGNGLSGTSITLAPKSACLLVATDAAGSKYWTRIG